MNQLRIGIVVVHWRGMRDTRACLASLEALDPAPASITVVVNGPGDFDEREARVACPPIRVVHAGENLGYAGGCNLGAREIAADADVLWFLNNDTIITPNALITISDAFAGDDAIGVAGPVVVYDDDPSLIWFAGGTLNRTFGYTRHIGFRTHVFPAAGRRVDFISGSAIAVRSSAWQRLGGFDESYFHYFEDTDLCERARALGYASYAIPDASVRHRVSAAAGDAGSNRLNRDQAYYFARNRWLFLRRNSSSARRYTALASQILLLLPYECSKALLTGNVAEIRGRAEGLIAGMSGYTGQRPS